MSSPYLYCDPRALLDAVGGDVDGYARLAAMFVDAAAPALDKLRLASAAGERARLQHLCHELRSSAILVGAVSLHGLLLRWEGALRDGQPGPAPADIEVIAQLLARVCAELQRAGRTP